MTQVAGWIETLNALVWGPPMMILLLGTGLWLTLGTRVVQVRRFLFAWRLLLQGAFRPRQKEQIPGEITPFQALMTALSGTIGNGNIAGVATAIALGGPGAPFWMWVTGLVGMATKYAEAVLGVRYRETSPDGTCSGGPMFALKHGLGWPRLGALYALFGALAAFGIGNMVQANSVALVFQSQLGVPGWVSGMVLAVLTWLVILGGIRRIATVAEFLVPFMCLGYLVGALIIILSHWRQIPAVYQLILESAFNGQAALGGFAGAGVAEAIRYGVARGIFSNEAGIGSAAIAHGAAQTPSPGQQGSVAMLGVFIDTLLINTLTTLSILLTGAWTTGLSSTALTAHAFQEALGTAGGWLVAFGSVTFGYSTLLTWSYYGLKCVEYLAGARVSVAYRWVWCGLILVGAWLSAETSGVRLVWEIADTANGAMAIPNLIALLGLSRVIFEEARRSDPNAYPPERTSSRDTPRPSWTER